MKVIVEADGGSRGNPGPAGFGAVVLDADTGAVLAERARFIGTETNNVAEYRGLIAGLSAAAQLGATDVAVRMDSKLVVQQMSGAWQIKHPGMRALAGEARALLGQFASTSFEWIPRALNARADSLANQAMDLGPGADISTTSGRDDPLRSGDQAAAPSAAAPVTHWTPPTGAATRLILVRHGATEHSLERRLSGRNDLPLTRRGAGQAAALAGRLASTPDVAAIVASPLRRAQETASHIAAALSMDVRLEEGLQEVDFGAWEGQTFAEVARTDAEAIAAWSRDPRSAPPNGESFEALANRLRPARDKILADHAGRTVIVVSHVTPIKMLLVDALGAPIESLYRVFLDTASVSLVDYPDGRLSSVRLINDTSHLAGELR